MTKEPEDKISFSQITLTGRELGYITQSLRSGATAGDGPFTKMCEAKLTDLLKAKRCLLTHSCTAALEMAALLAEIGPGDEVIMPSYTFVSTANAFVLRGATPVFVDIRPDTLNLDENLVDQAISRKSKAIVPVHYAGVSCEMTAICAAAKENRLIVIEDAAQGLDSYYKGRPLGTIGHLGALSFHQTKNISSGEGGALVINDERLIERAEIIWEKGTNRKNFRRGEVNFYSWVDVGSSFLPSDILAALLYSQLESLREIQERRLAIYQLYANGLKELDQLCGIQLPFSPAHCFHNAHMFYLLAPNVTVRDKIINFLSSAGVEGVFHYVPLHETPAGRRYGRPAGNLEVTSNVATRIIRLPLHGQLSDQQIDYIVTQLFVAARKFL